MVHPPSGRTLGQLLSHLNEQENLILVVCPEEFEFSMHAIVDELRSTESVQTHDLRLVTNMDKMRELQIMAKLVAYVRRQKDGETVGQRDQDHSPLCSAAANFPGPTLELPHEQAGAKLEIVAAIDAMRPLQIHPVPGRDPDESAED